MPLGIQAAESATRLSRALRLSGKVGLELDTMTSAIYSLIDLDQPAFRSDGIAASKGISVGTLNPIGANAAALLVNPTVQSLAVVRARIGNDTAGASAYVVGLPTTSALDQLVAMGFAGGITPLTTGERTTFPSTARDVEPGLFSTDVFNPPAFRDVFREVVGPFSGVEVVVGEPITIPPHGGLFFWDAGGANRSFFLNVTVKIWKGG